MTDPWDKLPGLSVHYGRTNQGRMLFYSAAGSKRSHMVTIHIQIDYVTPHGDHYQNVLHSFVVTLNWTAAFLHMLIERALDRYSDRVVVLPGWSR